MPFTMTERPRRRRRAAPQDSARRNQRELSRDLSGESVPLLAHRHALALHHRYDLAWGFAVSLVPVDGYSKQFVVTKTNRWRFVWFHNLCSASRPLNQIHVRRAFSNVA